MVKITTVDINNMRLKDCDNACVLHLPKRYQKDNAGLSYTDITVIDLPVRTMLLRFSSRTTITVYVSTQCLKMFMLHSHFN